MTGNLEAPDQGSGDSILDDDSIAWLDKYADDEAPRRENEAAVRRGLDILSRIWSRK